MQEESPEGGRFKKEILVDGQSHLLLIRDEGGPPEVQFTSWVDAVIFVFSLENEASFNAIYNYFTKMAYYRNTSEIPLILVGTQDAISENNPRVIDDARARKLAADLKRCSYYETCATYGLNVERVFQDACQKIVQQRLSSSSCLTPTNSRPETPNNHFHLSSSRLASHPVAPSPTNGFSSSTGSPASNTLSSASPSHNNHILSNKHHTLSASTHHLHRNSENNHKLSSCDLIVSEQCGKWSNTLNHGSSQTLMSIATENNNIAKFATPQYLDNLQPPHKDSKDLTTPSSTPTTSRKSRRRSNLFTPSKKGEDKLKGSELGSGRAIPLKQGYLYKRSSKPLNKDWKKKYVTLCDDGRLTYHPSLHDYMDDVHSKEISLQYVTVKVPGQKPRGSKSIITTIGNHHMNNGQCAINEGIGGLSIANKRITDRVMLTSMEALRDTSLQVPRTSITPNNDDSSMPPPQQNGSSDNRLETPQVKKRHRRMKSSGVKNELDDGDSYEFYIVSLDNKQWHFEAANPEERDEWVSAIEQQILNSLQGNETSKAKLRLNNPNEISSICSIRSRVPGNSVCADCDAPNPDWASLNLGVLVCIECSGIHRNLGSHISRIRSLDLDEWPPGHLSVMLALGNTLANSIWESNIQSNYYHKPSPTSSREEKESWIRNKYEHKKFLAPINQNASIGQQLIDAVCRVDMKAIALLLAHANSDQVNATVGTRDLRTPLHLACALGNLAIAQLLLWHNADVKLLDHDGRSCLLYSRAAASLAAANSQNITGIETTSALVDLLSMHGCPEPVAHMPAPNSGTLPRRCDNVCSH
ncbi:centaurin-gamma-1A-like isoform X1 [Ctenocephalides felis]|nr:centaurin-gamma-1A-like isoform X1 [Ctenocephalides felis]